MKNYLLIPVVVVALLAPPAVLAAGGGNDKGFDGVTRFIEGRYHVKPARVPIPWWVKAISHKAVRDVRTAMPMAEFGKFSGPVDTDELYRVVKEKLGPGWEQVIRETGRKPDSTALIPHGWDRKGNEQTLMFVHPGGEQMGVFFLDYDGDQMFIMQISIDPAQVKDTVSEYKNPGDGHLSD